MTKETVEPGTPADESPLALLDTRCQFGPLFFLRHLGAFVRERCPDPSEGLPIVLLHLVDGEVLDVCHAIGLAPGWAALAVNDTERSPETKMMRTELVPYETIHRVTIRSVRPAEVHVGFAQDQVPQVLSAATAADIRSPEAALRAAATPAPHVHHQPRASREGRDGGRTERVR